MGCGENVYTGDITSFLHLFYIIGISIVGLFCFISFCIFLITIKQLVCNNTETINKMYKCLTLSCILFMVTCCIGDWTHLIIDMLYYFGNISFYILSLSRIYNTFHINKVIVLFLWSLVITFTLSAAGFIMKNTPA